MKRLLGQARIDDSGVIHTLPLFLIIAAVGIISYLLISSTAPFKGGLFGVLNPKPQSNAATSPLIDMAYPCGFTNPAFCDNFSEGPAVGANRGRGNDLDSSKWSFNRIAPGGRFGSSLMGYGSVTQVEHCKDIISNVALDGDSFMCGSEVPEPEHWMEANDAHGGIELNDALIRQPFDFTNRTGLIQYGVDLKSTGSHGWWTETWITDEPVPGTHNPPDTGNDNPNASTPRNGIGIQFWPHCQTLPVPADYFLHGNSSTSVGIIRLAEGYQWQTSIDNEFGDFGGNTCALTQDDSSNMVQIKLSKTRIEVWASDHGSNVLHQIAGANINPPLPFSVGYVHFIHAAYNPDKAGAAQFSTYHWHDMGFDGPVHPLPKVYEVPDPKAQGGTDEGYLIHADGSISDADNHTQQAFAFNNVDLTGASSANLIMTTLGWSKGSNIFYSWNNGPQVTYPWPAAMTNEGYSQGAVIPIPLSNLKQGTNTLKLKTDTTYNVGTMVVANVDLIVNPPDSSTPAPFAGTISCNLMTLMMGVMPSMTMPTDPCTNNPNVGFTQPAQGAYFVGPGATVPVTVNATPKSPATSITKVVLSQGTTTMATLTQTPYNFTWNNVAVGSYVLTATATDNLGNIGIGQINVTILPPTPVISGVTSSNIQSDQAIISWSTDKPGDSQVEYGITNSYGSSTPVNSAQVTTHNVVLNGLNANTTYHFRAKSSNSAGTGTSGDFLFTTVLPPPNPLQFSAQYWNTPTAGAAPTMPTTTPDLTRTDNGINFDWSGGSPDPVINSSHYVVRWTGTLSVPTAGSYAFTATVDDGVRLYIDGTLVLDHWIDEGATPYTTTQNLTVGNHTIKMEYYQDAGGAVAKLGWQTSVPTATPAPTASSTPVPSPTPTLAPTPTPGTCPKKSLGDVDCDGVIGIFDFNTLVTNFGKTGIGIAGDLDGNGKVDIFDFNTLVTNFGH